MAKAIKVGPWGGKGGSTWDTLVVTQDITHIKIYYGDVIDGLDITYVTNGKRQTLKVGDTIGAVWNEIILKKDEYFNSISGFYGPTIPKDVIAIKQLTLGTNKGTSVTVGTTQGGDFPFPYSPLPPHYKIVGFHGHATTVIDAIGIYYEEK
ncbi:unnamed protein product [Musa acuminata subsp. burmannicoides]